MKSGIEDRDAVHLALDQDDVVEPADRLLGKMQVEEHARLAVDGRLGELRYLGPDLSSVARVRPVKAMTLPLSLQMGKMMRLRNLL